MAVEAAPDFYHADARAGGPAAVRASERAVAARHRATSLKVILLSAVLAVAGIGGVYAEECKPVAYLPTKAWHCVAAMPMKVTSGGMGPSFVRPGMADEIHCFFQRPVEILYQCCEHYFHALESEQYGRTVQYNANKLTLGIHAPAASALATATTPLVGSVMAGAVGTFLKIVPGIDISAHALHPKETGIKCKVPPPEEKKFQPFKPPTMKCPGEESYWGILINSNKVIEEHWFWSDEYEEVEVERRKDPRKDKNDKK